MKKAKKAVAKTIACYVPSCIICNQVEVINKLWKWWNDYGGKLPHKQYVILGDILEELNEKIFKKKNEKNYENISGMY